MPKSNLNISTHRTPKDLRERLGEYKTNLSGMSEKDLYDETKQMIWLSAYANNNPRSDYHWKCDETYAECKRRERTDIYTKAYDANMESVTSD